MCFEFVNDMGRQVFVGAASSVWWFGDKNPTSPLFVVWDECQFKPKHSPALTLRGYEGWCECTAEKWEAFLNYF